MKLLHSGILFLGVGQYVQKREEDRDEILAFFGNDFVGQ